MGEDRVKNGQEMDVHYLALFELNLNIENGLSVYSWIQKYIDEVDKCFPGAKDMYEKGLSLTGTETAIPAPMLVASYIAYWYNAYKEADVSHKLSDRGLMIQRDLFSGCQLLSEVTYKGTVSNFKVLTNGFFSDLLSPTRASYVQCSDGKVTLS